MKKITIIFGSTAGNTELVCEKVKDVLNKKGFSVCLRRVEKSGIEDVLQSENCILAASTYGHGVLQDHFIPFAEKLKKADLVGIRFAVIGLGDDKYDAEYNVESATILEDIIRNGDGEIVLPALRINRSPVRQLDGAVQKWAENLAKILKN